MTAINFTTLKVFIMQFSSRNFSTFRLVSTRMNNRNVESQEIYIQNFVTNMLS
jgi:hypothetical protein